MNRRQFLRTTALAAAGTALAPYILPTGRLFAATGSRIANHVVFVLFGGGLRNQETVLQQYLAAQGLPTQGNILPNLLSGPQPSSNKIYNPWKPILSSPLAKQGTLFPEIRYKSGPTGHFNGHTVAMTGVYSPIDLNLNVNPESPTLFEYYRKHSDPAKSAVNAWWLSEGLGPFPALNYSRHREYGPGYGANYLRPMTTFIEQGGKQFSAIPDFQPNDAAKENAIRNFLDAGFSGAARTLPGVRNEEGDKARIEQFIKETVQKTSSGQVPFALPSGVGANELTGDLVNITYAWQVLDKFAPELMVINTFDSDICHSDFSGYIQLMHKADYGVGWLWDKIQSHPTLKDDTIMICMPEHGRNLAPNGLYDRNGLRAYDHTSDDNSRRIFALVVGPKSKVKQGQVVGSEANPIGESIDIVPTIAHILGFNSGIPAGMLPGRALKEAFF